MSDEDELSPAERELEAALAFRVGVGPTSLGAKYVTGNNPSGAIPI